MERVVAYLDDTIVFDPDPTDHIADMQAHGRLRKHHLKLSLSKAKISATTADFLGHTISAGGYIPNFDKIAAHTRIPMSTQRNRCGQSWEA